MNHYGIFNTVREWQKVCSTHRRNGQPRIARCCNLAIAPRLFTNKVNHISTILPLLGAPLVNITLAVGYASSIWIDNGIAFIAPVSRIRTLELLQFRELALRDAESKGKIVQYLITTAALFAIWRPGDECWAFQPRCRRSEYVDIDCGAIS